MNVSVKKMLLRKFEFILLSLFYLLLLCRISKEEIKNFAAFIEIKELTYEK